MTALPLALLGFLGMQELMIILIIVLVLFGASRVPKLMRGLGQGIKEFKDATKGSLDDDDPAADAKPEATKASEEK